MKRENISETPSQHASLSANKCCYLRPHPGCSPRHTCSNMPGGLAGWSPLIEQEELPTQAEQGQAQVFSRKSNITILSLIGFAPRVHLAGADGLLEYKCKGSLFVLSIVCKTANIRGQTIRMGYHVVRRGFVSGRMPQGCWCRFRVSESCINDRRASRTQRAQPLRNQTTRDSNSGPSVATLSIE